MAIEKVSELISEHTKLDSHPVGMALIKRLEEQLKTHIDNNAKEFSQHVASDEKSEKELKNNFKDAIDCSEKMTTAKLSLIEVEIAGMTSKQELVNQRHFERIIRLENYNSEQISKDNDELRSWRNKASGLSTPGAVVPLVPRETMEPQKK